MGHSTVSKPTNQPRLNPTLLLAIQDLCSLISKWAKVSMSWYMIVPCSVPGTQ